MAYPERHIIELDGLRGIAVIMVMIWHFVGSMVDPNLGLWAQAINSTTIFGRTGVDLFFVLSGFLIIGILIENRNSPTLFRTFYVRRAARIFPAYFLLISLYWMCYAITGPTAAFNAKYGFLPHIASQVLFAYNWLMAIDNGAVARGFSVTWSVAIEEQFYLVAPIALWLTPPRLLRRVLLCVAIAAIALRAGCYLVFPGQGLAVYILPFTRIDCLCAGGLLATIWRDKQAVESLRPYAPVALIALSPFAALMTYSINYNLFFHMHLWGHTFLSVFYFFVLLVVLLFRPQFLRFKPFVMAGTVSYGLYLFHPLSISLIFQTAGRSETIASWTDVGLAVTALLLAVAMCYASYVLVETPIRRLGA